MKIEEPDLTGTYSYSDYLTWQWTEMAEVIRGKIYKMSPAPSSTHQKVSGNLFGLLWNYLRDKKCQVFTAPFDVRLPLSLKQNTDKEIITVVQPDLCVVCDPSKIDERGCLGAPDWIIEILDRKSVVKGKSVDLDGRRVIEKKEYWVVHPQEQTILIYLLD